MAGERMYPLLPCSDLDQAIAFYQALGFRQTAKQLRPNPYATVAREDMHIHLFGMDGFNPADSYASVIIVVPDPDALYQDFAAGLRAAYGKLPVAGIPRLLRPRKKYGTVTGFSVVDTGGNWLRIYKLGDTEPDEAEEKAEGLAQTLRVAARLGDAKGDVQQALKTLASGLKRYGKTAEAAELAQAYLYRAELAVRAGDMALAGESLAGAEGLDLPSEAREALAEEFAHVRELVGAA